MGVVGGVLLAKPSVARKGTDSLCGSRLCVQVAPMDTAHICHGMALSSGRCYDIAHRVKDYKGAKRNPREYIWVTSMYVLVQKCNDHMEERTCQVNAFPVPGCICPYLMCNCSKPLARLCVLEQTYVRCRRQQCRTIVWWICVYKNNVFEWPCPCGRVIV